MNRENLIANAIKTNSRSVVGIHVTMIENNGRVSKGFGSGVSIDKEGYIVTNAHVVEFADTITVITVGGKEFIAKIIGTDRLSDIALIKIESKNLSPATLSESSNNLVRGEWVIAMGNPYNLFSASKEPTATIGIISGNNVNFGLKGEHVYQNMIQTDASINPGNSGGPLINLEGEVIGINTFIVNESRGMGGIGFSIPINRVKNIVNDLHRFGNVDRSWVTGISVRKIDEKYKRYLKLNFDNGVIVSDVEKKSAAEFAGIKIRDVIYKVDGKIVNSASDIEEVLDEGYFKTGDDVAITLKRKSLNISNEMQQIEVKLKLIDPNDK